MGIHGISLGSVETRSPVRSQLNELRFIFLFIIALPFHTTQSLDLLFLAIDFVIQGRYAEGETTRTNFFGDLRLVFIFYLLGFLI